MTQHPEAEFVRNTYTIRQMDLPPSTKLTKRSLLRWFALSFGLLSEQESRSTVLDILDALFTLQITRNQNPTTQDLQRYLKEKQNKEVSEKLMRYHLNRLIALNFLQRKRNRYVFNNSPSAEPKDLKASFSHWIEKPVAESLQNIADVVEKLQQSYRR